MAELDLDKIKKQKFNISVENLVTIGAVVVTVVGMWFALQADIEEAKALTETDPAIKAGVLKMDLKECAGSAALMMVNELHEKIAKKSF